EAHGNWRNYYSKWPQVTRSIAPSDMFELIPPLPNYIPPASSFEKYANSAFSSPDFITYLRSKNVDTLIVSGAETDVCVAASVFSAIDFGYRVVIAADAVCSSSDEGNDYVRKIMGGRF